MEFKLTNKKNNPEQVLKRAICQWLTYQRIFFWVQPSVGIFDAKRGFYRKNNSPYMKKGISDILGIIRGRLLAIEVKSKTGKPTPEQIQFLRDVYSQGGISMVARSLDDVINGLNSRFVLPAFQIPATPDKV